MDLTTKYMGLELKNPIVPGASPLSQTVDSVKRLEDEGASAIVLYSLFEEQLSHDQGELDHYLSFGAESFAEAVNYFPSVEEFKTGPVEYLEHIANLKKAVGIPVIGSLNGVSKGGWVEYAQNMEQAGADAIELNIYYVATNPDLSGSEVEAMYIDTIKAIKEKVKIPVAVKIGPYFTSISNMAKKMDEAGADALVLFNRFYQPDFNLDDLSVESNLMLSSNWELRLPLRWISILYGNVKANLAATSGVHNSLDVVKTVMAGADITQVASALLLEGSGKVNSLIKGVAEWMEEKEYSSISQMKGSMSQKSCSEPAAFERANYMKMLNSYKPQI
ncbi:MAG: dihydroorotate dehydrogenase-like protein [Melioribacteraceae bacterium]|nr:dihydroorotate dehydrogenase-like protein [Melioribacteraceae bacterium]